MFIKVIKDGFNTMVHAHTKGREGENVACEFLRRNGFTLVNRNFSRRWGELDIIAQKDMTIHFFEVKSVTSDMLGKFFDAHRPEENVDGWKVKHIRRMIETYIDIMYGGKGVEFEFHILCVYMNTRTRIARVRWMRNLIL